MSYSIRDAFKSLEEIDDVIENNSTIKQVENKPKIKVSQSQVKLNENKKSTVRPTNRHLLENSYKLTNDEDVEEAKEVLEDNENPQSDNIEVIVDVDAESEEELKDSYIGSIIIECPVCQTKIYKNREDLTIEGQDDEEEQSLEDATVNVGEACPHCKQEDGFIVIGKVAPIENKEDSSNSAENALESEDLPQDEEEVEDDEKIDSAANWDENTEESEDDEEEIQAKGFSLEDNGEDIKESMTSIHLTPLSSTHSLVETNKHKNEVDINIKSIDTSSFNKLVENYLHEVYDNISDYTTTNTSVLDNEGKIIIEGKIIFKSGKCNTTKFIFEACEITKHNLIKFKGMNETFSKSKRAFTLHSQVKEDILMSKHLTYDYLAKSINESKSTKIYGRVSTIEGTR